MRTVPHFLATHVRIERTNEGADVALQIESEEGLAAILRFTTTAR